MDHPAIAASMLDFEGLRLWYLTFLPDDGRKAETPLGVAGSTATYQQGD
jgi:hypothetical protein